MVKIAVIDSWNFKFSAPIINYWKRMGHEVTANKYWSAEYTEDADVCYFPVVDGLLIQASKKQSPSPHRRVIAEAVDIDIYANHLGAVNWEYVDALIFMAQHKKDLGFRKSGKNIPTDLPIHIVPAGVDLGAWTPRRDTARGYNIVWIGRLWIGKGIFNAIQVFNQLVKADPSNPWRLYIRGDEVLNPEWWKDHVEAYIDANGRLDGRIEFVPFQKDLNEWLESMSYLLQTSMKEAHGYVVSQSAAKGIKPIVQMTNGALDTWPASWVFQTHDEAVQMFLGNGYEPSSYRAYVEERYPLSNRCATMDEICGLSEAI